MLGHHAEFNAPSTARLTSTVTSPDMTPSSTQSFSVMTAIDCTCLRPEAVLVLIHVLFGMDVMVFSVYHQFSRTLPPMFK